MLSQQEQVNGFYTTLFVPPAPLDMPLFQDQRSWPDRVVDWRADATRAVSVRTDLEVRADAALLTLDGQGQFYGDNGQVPNHEAWPEALAVPPRAPVHNRTWINVHNELTLNFTSPNARVNMSALPLGKRSYPRVIEHPMPHGLNTTTLTEVVVPLEPPLFQDMRSYPDRVVPDSKVATQYASTRSQQEVAPNLVVGVLDGQGQFYGDPGQAITFGVTNRQRTIPPLVLDWLWPGTTIPLETMPDGRIAGDPNPLRRPPLHQDWSVRYTLSLIGQDTFYGEPGQTAWPVPPMLPIKQRAALVVYDPLNLQPQFAFAPPEDQPIGLRSLSSIPTWLERVPPLHQDASESYTLVLIGQDQFYAEPGQVPQLALRADPNPLRRPPLHQDFQQRGQFVPLEVLPDGRVWAEPNPLRRAPLHQDWQRRGTELLLETFAVGNLRWTEPNPLKRAPLHQDHLAFLALPISAPDSFYGAVGQVITRYDELPLRAKRAIDLRNFSFMPLVAVLAPPGNVFLRILALSVRERGLLEATILPKSDMLETTIRATMHVIMTERDD